MFMHYDLALNNLEKRGQKKKRLDDVDDGGKPPAIAVLPFKNLSNDEEQEYFGMGLQDIIANLSL